MSMLTSCLLLAAGLAALVLGAELFVRGASRLAAVLGVSPLVIGLTVVAYGTSTPELAVSVHAGLTGSADIALGNVVGSNLCNVLLILGLSAVILPLGVSRQLVRWEVPVMIGTSLVLLLMALDGNISRPEGWLLVAGCVAYTVWSIRQGRKETRESRQNREGADAPTAVPASRRGLVSGGLIVAGFAVLILGSDWVVRSAVVIAGSFGIGELVIGLTIVAVGTSLPELATSVVATLRGERDIAVGNVVGSNIFNILMVLGLSAAVSPQGVNVAPAALCFDIPVMIAVAVCCLPIFFTGSVISRWEGVFLLAYYAAYTLYLVVNANQRQVTATLDPMLIVFTMPIMAVTLLALGQSVRRTRRRFAAP